MCEFACIGSFLIFIVFLISFTVTFIGQVINGGEEKGYCIKGTPHDWVMGEPTLEGIEKTCRRCGITVYEDN